MGCVQTKDEASPAEDAADLEQPGGGSHKGSAPPPPGQQRRRHRRGAPGKAVPGVPLPSGLSSFAGSAPRQAEAQQPDVCPPKGSVRVTHSAASSHPVPSMPGVYQGSAKMPARQILVGQAVRWSHPAGSHQPRQRAAAPAPASPAEPQENPLLSALPPVRPAGGVAGGRPDTATTATTAATATATPVAVPPPNLKEAAGDITTLRAYRKGLSEFEESSGAAWTIRGVLHCPLPSAVRQAVEAEEERLLEAWRASLGKGGGSGDAVGDAFHTALCGEMAADSDTCSGAGRRTERAQRSRENLVEAYRLARGVVAGAGGGWGKLNLLQCYTDINARIYANVLEAVPPDLMGRSRSVGDLDVNAGKLKVFPASEVDAAMQEVQAYLRGQVGSPGMEVVARVFMALISIHPCPDGNGRTSACLAAALAESAGLPPMNLKGCRVIRSFGGQVGVQQNNTPVDAVVATAAAMWRSVELLRQHPGGEGAKSDGLTTSPGSAHGESSLQLSDGAAEDAHADITQREVHARDVSEVHVSVGAPKR